MSFKEALLLSVFKYKSLKIETVIEIQRFFYFLIFIRDKDFLFEERNTNFSQFLFNNDRKSCNWKNIKNAWLPNKVVISVSRGGHLGLGSWRRYIINIYINTQSRSCDIMSSKPLRTQGFLSFGYQMTTARKFFFYDVPNSEWKSCGTKDVCFWYTWGQQRLFNDKILVNL